MHIFDKWTKDEPRCQYPANIYIATRRLYLLFSISQGLSKTEKYYRESKRSSVYKKKDEHDFGPWRETTLKTTSPGGKGLVQPCLSVKMPERVSILPYRLLVYLRQLLERFEYFPKRALSSSFKRDLNKRQRRTCGRDV